MRTEIIERTILEFNELTVEQKSKVYDNLRDINTDYNWHEHIEEDFHSILDLLGFYNIESYFTGFSSQGDGASFKAMFTVPSKNDKIRDRLNKLKEYAPFYFRKNKRLLLELLDLDCQLSGYHEDIEVSQSGRYYHSNTMSCDNDNLLSVAQDLANKYYSDLESEYYYLMSDTSIKETIEANEYEFYNDTLEIA